MTAVHVELGCAAVLFDLDGVLVDSLDTNGPTRCPGAARMIAALPPDRWAVVTPGNGPKATAWLRDVRLPVPDIMITGGAPSPEGFLLAAERLGVPASQCVVVAAAHPSVLAARAAGCRVVGIAREPLGPRTGPDLVVTSLADLRAASDGNTITLHVDERMEGRTW